MNLQIGIADFWGAWARRNVALYFAWTETLARYRRSLLGPFWLVLGTMIGVVGLGFVWSALLRSDPHEFIPSLCFGLVTWQLISGAITEATGVFSRASHSILNIRLPTFLHALQLLLRHLINLAHNLVVVVVVVGMYPDQVGPVMLLAIPGLVIVSASLFGLIQLLGYFGARFRDLEPLVTAFMPILFFLSPVIFQSRQLGSAQRVMEFNPLAHWIRIVRDPLMGLAPTAENYAVAILLLVAIWAAALWITSARAHRLPYWL